MSQLVEKIVFLLAAPEISSASSSTSSAWRYRNQLPPRPWRNCSRISSNGAEPLVERDQVHAGGRPDRSRAVPRVGIAPGDQEAVFEEFRQVGKAAKKVEGTGLGLTLCRKFVELYGARFGSRARWAWARRSSSAFRCGARNKLRE